MNILPRRRSAFCLLLLLLLLLACCYRRAAAAVLLLYIFSLRWAFWASRSISWALRAVLLGGAAAVHGTLLLFLFLSSVLLRLLRLPLTFLLTWGLDSLAICTSTTMPGAVAVAVKHNAGPVLFCASSIDIMWLHSSMTDLQYHSASSGPVATCRVRHLLMFYFYTSGQLL